MVGLPGGQAAVLCDRSLEGRPTTKHRRHEESQSFLASTRHSGASRVPKALQRERRQDAGRKGLAVNPMSFTPSADFAAANRLALSPPD